MPQAHVILQWPAVLVVLMSPKEVSMLYVQPLHVN